jgi:hypothetical protein
METIEKNITDTPDLSWVAATGGPEVRCEDGRSVTGLPEDGWRAWAWRSGPTELRRHEKWVEPATGFSGTLMVELSSSGQGVAWEALFMWSPNGDDGEACIPLRASGYSADFHAAREVALAWRPIVEVIDGVELWTDPHSMRGEARGVRSGELSWWPQGADGSIRWSFKPAGVKELELFDWHCQSIEGTAASLEDMLHQVSEARDRLRAAMRNYLLNF